jgi:hypothetical protein
VLDEVLNISFGDRAHGSLWLEKWQYEGVQVQPKRFDAPLRTALLCESIK